MAFFDILSVIEKNLSSTVTLKTDRIPTINPSMAMCYSAIDSSPLGSCLRQVYMEKMDYPRSNPMGIYVKMTTEAGRLWESWVIEQYKQLGIYINHSVKIYDPERFISGEIDILHKNLDTGELEITEVKQYNGSNFYAAGSLLGTKKDHAKPKDQNLLQVFTYLLMTKDQISSINLLYIDRSCGSFYNNKQFVIKLFEQNDKIYPRIMYKDHENKVTEYIDYRINNKNLKEKEDMLKEFLKGEIIPPRDFNITYSSTEIEAKFLQSIISKTKYNKWKENPKTNPIGDWQCQYCQFGPDKNEFSSCASLGD
jgi:Holliday junction resolvase-like predicted endonuclease